MDLTPPALFFRDYMNDMMGRNKDEYQMGEQAQQPMNPNVEVPSYPPAVPPGGDSNPAGYNPTPYPPAPPPGGSAPPYPPAAGGAAPPLYPPVPPADGSAPPYPPAGGVAPPYPTNDAPPYPPAYPPQPAYNPTA